MSRVLGGTSEPGRPDEPDSKFAIYIIVPEEFAGMSMHYERTPRFRRLKLRMGLGCAADSGWLTSASKGPS
jgi:hypothetical protein